MPSKPGSVHQRANHHALPARKHKATNPSQYFWYVPTHYLQSHQQRTQCAGRGVTATTKAERPQSPTAIRTRWHARTMLVVEKTLETLYSGKHHKAGHNLQILTDQAGEIFYIAEPLPGSTHDITAIRNTGLFDHMQPWHITADKGYVGLGCDTPFKRRPGKPLLDWQQRFNKGINAIRYVVERSIAHLKVWRILSTPSRLPRNTTIRAINVIRKIMFYQPPTKPHFPSS